jgi:DNA replication protein DnaC
MTTWNSRLPKRTPGPKRRILPSVERSSNLVDSQLRETLRDLINGKAAWPLIIFGPAGSGKSFAALSLCDYARTAAFWSLEESCDAIMGAGGEKGRLLRESRTKDLFIIDEIGIRDRAGDLERSTLKRILDLREHYQGRRTIAISNRTPSELAAVYDDPIVSRLACGTRFKLDGTDRRMTR